MRPPQTINLESLFERLYGPKWQKAAREELGVDRNTIWRWVTGGEIPGPVMAWARAKLEIERYRRLARHRKRRMFARRAAEAQEGVS